MRKALAGGVVFGLLFFLCGCGAGVIHQTTGKDLQPNSVEDTKNKVKSLFYESRTSIGAYYTKAVIKISNEGFHVISEEGRGQANCDWAVGDPFVKDWGPLANRHYAVHLNGCNAEFWFNDQEKAMQFAQLLYTLKHQATEYAGGRDVPSAAASRKVQAVATEIDTPPILVPEPRTNVYAVVVGIESYRSLPKSDYSERDASLMKAYLKALGYPERNIELLTSEKATKTDLEKSLEAWLPKRVKKDSTVFVYFSGHGAPEPATGDAYLVPYDGDPNYLPVTGYPLKRLYEKLGKLEAKEVIVVLDSCFSGAGGRSVLAKGARPLVMTAATETPAANMVVLSATKGNQISTSSPDKGHGVFTYYFLKAIRDGKRDIAEIFEQIVPQVEDEAKKLNVEQIPSVSPDVEKLKGRFGLRK